MGNVIQFCLSHYKPLIQLLNTSSTRQLGLSISLIANNVANKTLGICVTEPTEKYSKPFLNHNNFLNN